MMFPLHFHYEDVSRQDPLLKPNHANVMEVPGSCEIRLVPASDFRILFGKLAMEMTRGFQTKRGLQAGKSFGSEKDTGYERESTDFARKSALRGSNFLVRISTVMSLFYSPVEIRANVVCILFSTEFCEFSPELEDHFEIFEHLRGFNVTIVTSANTKDETLPPWSGFLLKDEEKKPQSDVG
nr:ribosomal protein L5 [Gastrodia pubilabiata]WMV02131.1 ribosomal protein L5 [Gastrodia peichatieniana]WNH36824.1 ribosomal protein L5 [Gastrodia uraiensis]WNI02132.1 ribosomal protein L5 [Gastrodia menghaiensis]WOE91383.1 ribosomal protein L5 [Gastrodia crispa]WOE91448.1 ribosomal protein L5 [Gastrodia flexistyla]